MKLAQKLIYGNYFHGGAIDPLLFLNIQDIPASGSFVEIEKILEITKKIGPKLKFFLTAYPDNSLYLDVSTKPTEINKYSIKQSVKDVDRNLDSLYKKYAELTDVAKSGETIQDIVSNTYVSRNHQVASIEQQFVNLTNKFQDRLIRVAKSSVNSEDRATAVYLLSWCNQKDKIINLTLDVLFSDPDPQVQNNAARSLLALLHQKQINETVSKKIINLIYSDYPPVINKVLNLLLDDSIKLHVSKEQFQKLLHRLSDIAESAVQPHINLLAKDLRSRLARSLPL